MRADQEAGAEGAASMSILPLSCAAHSVVLAMRPTLERFNKLPSMLVKLSHILESSRAASHFEGELRKEVGEHFVYKSVRALPAEAIAWRHESVRVWTLARAARDLTEADERHVLHIANGRWSEETELVYFCVKGSCEAGCAGPPARSKDIFISTVPLLCRWKGFEQASAWCFRGRKVFDLLLRAFHRMFPLSVVRRAQEEAACAAASGSEVELHNRQQVRGGAVLQLLESDVGGRSVEAALVLHIPLQDFLNSVFSAEAVTMQAADGMAATPSNRRPLPIDAAIRRDACVKNLGIITGDRGRRTIRGLGAQLMSFSTGSWIGMSMELGEKWRLSLRIVVSIGGAA